MMKRLAAAGIVTAAMGGVLLTAAPAMANDDRNTVNQEKVLEVNLLCNVGVLAVQKGLNCGGSDADIKDNDQANVTKITKTKHKKKHY